MVGGEMNVRWQITLLGRLRAEREGFTLAHFRRQKTGFLLAYLAYYPHRSHPRDALIELLWPDADFAAGRASLSVALSFLRQHLEPPGSSPGSVLIADRSSVRLNPNTISTDVAAFEALLRDASRTGDPQEKLRCLTEAAEWYQGELLPGCYDEWARLERERLAEAYLQGLTELIRLLEAQGDLSRALNYARRAVGADPLREESHQELIRLLGATGQAQAARRQFAELERILKAELDAVPAAETQALVAALGNGETRRAVESGELDLLSPALPSGTVTFLLTELRAGSREPFSPASPVRESYHALLRGLIRRHGGWEVKQLPGGFLNLFQGAGDALACAVALQRALATHSLPQTAERFESAASAPVRVCAALDTCEAYPEDGEFRTPTLAMVQRLVAVGHGGQILCSETTAMLLRRDLEPGARLVDLGLYRLQGGVVPSGDAGSPGTLPSEAREGCQGVERLFQVEFPEMEPASFPPLRAEACAGGHLPPVLTRFFGREHERSALEKLLGSDGVRLVTLIGPGGSGKTRLALEVARGLIESWRGAVWLVPLADLTEARRIPEAIRQALSLSPSAHEEPLQQVIVALSDRPTLLLLDNLEHLLPEGASLVRRLLSRVPGLTCLVTSRQRLHLSGERVFSVPPLPVPTNDQRPTTNDGRRPTVPPGLPTTSATAGTMPTLVVGRWSLVDCPSVQLFLDRAEAGSPDFALTAANATAVASLCRRLEGLPLAIELAAARAGVLTPGQILAQVERGLGVLSSRQRDVPERHRSLRATVEWSYRLLEPSLQRFFARLSVFRGGFGLEAAEAVCSNAVDSCQLTVDSRKRDPSSLSTVNCQRSTIDVLDNLEQLRECSLVLTDVAARGQPNGLDMRFRLLETLREYGREQLSAQERTELERCHAEHFLAWAEQAREELLQRPGSVHPAWLERLESEHDNLRAAMSWAVEQKEVEIALRLVVAIGTFWEHRGYLTEGRERLAAALALTDSSGRGEDLSNATRSVCAWALRNAGALAWRQSDYGTARVLLDESIAIHRRLSDRLGILSALHILGGVVCNQGDLTTSRAVGAEALAIAREIGSATHTAIALHNLARVALAQSDFETARPLYTESLSLARELGERYNEAYALHGLGEVDHCLGDWRSARAFYEACLTLRRELGDRLGVGMVLSDLGLLARDQGDYESARACFEESLVIRRELGDRRGITLSLHGMGTVATCEGREAVAQELLKEALAIARPDTQEAGSGDRDIAAVLMVELGDVFSRRGDHKAARALLEESLATFREMGDQMWIGAALCLLGRLAADQGNTDASAAYLTESLSTYRRVGNRHGTAQVLEGLARLAMALGSPQRTARLCAAAAALREALGAPVPPVDRADFRARLAEARAGLGEEAFVVAWEEGRAMTMAEATRYALEQ